MINPSEIVARYPPEFSWQANGSHHTPAFCEMLADEIYPVWCSMRSGHSAAAT